MDKADFDKIVKRLMVSCRYAPLMDDFEKYGESEIAQMNEVIRQSDDQLLKGIKCEWCGNTGIISLRKKEAMHEYYSFLCTKCKVAELKKLPVYLFRKYDSSLLNEYTREWK